MEAEAAGGGGLFFIIQLALIIVMLVSMWRIFDKAVEPGWLGIIPIVNIFFLLKIIGKPWWWIILLFIPIVNIVIGILMWHGLSISFGKGALFTVGLIFLSFIFLPILAFGDADYEG